MSVTNILQLVCDLSAIILPFKHCSNGGNLYHAINLLLNLVTGKCLLLTLIGPFEYDCVSKYITCGVRNLSKQWYILKFQCNDAI